jgi:hypothetical protein
MSTPTGKSFDLTEQQHSEDNDPLHSPDVPKRADDRSPYGPKRGHTQTTVEAGFIRNEDAPSLAPPHAPEDSREHSTARRHAAAIGDSRGYANDAGGHARAPTMPLPRERDDHSRMTAFEDAAARRRLVAPDPAISLQPAHPKVGLSSTRRDKATSDLDRLEAVLRQLVREQPAARLPRAAQLPPVPGLHPIGEMSLDHTYLVPPAAIMSSGDRRRWPLGVLISGICALPIAYYFITGNWFPPSGPGPQLTSVDARTVAPSSQAEVRIKAQDDDAARPADNEMASQRAETSRTARLSERETVAPLRPDEKIDTQVSPTKGTVRVLDPAEVNLLAKQGEQFAQAGDFVTARLLFQRAAEAGHAAAATALGATYDPIVLGKLGVVGIDDDVAKARFWYQRAVNLGSSDAIRRLDLLANRKPLAR